LIFARILQLDVTAKVVTIGGVQMNRYKCRRGSNPLEGLHSHLLRAVPSHRCGIMQFQVCTTDILVMKLILVIVIVSFQVHNFYIT